MMNMQAVDKSKQVNKPFLIFVEGVSDKAMLAEYIRSVGLNKQLPSYQIISSDSKDKFSALFRNITTQAKFQDVTHLAVFRDADLSADKAFQSVQTQLRINTNIPDDALPKQALVVKTSEETGLKIGVFIVPDANLEGSLEHLLLNSLSDEMREHIKNYIANGKKLIHAEAQDHCKNTAKSHSYAYSSLFEIENFKDSFRIQSWDWQHKTFEHLKIFLEAFK
jgi:predicted ATP-dependent endonuclease of OLD family